MTELIIKTDEKIRIIGDNLKIEVLACKFLSSAKFREKLLEPSKKRGPYKKHKPILEKPIKKKRGRPGKIPLTESETEGEDEDESEDDLLKGPEEDDN